MGRGLLLAGALCVASSCSSPKRGFDQNGLAGASGAEIGGVGGSTAPPAGADSGAQAGTPEAGSGAMSSIGGMAEGGQAGASSAEAGAAEAGAAGAPGDCQPNATRSCRDAGALGQCAAGIETCTAERIWGACSVKPAAKDTCAVNNDDNCNGIVNEGCPCVSGESRSCKDAGALGKCATGTQACTGAGGWGGCSIVPASKDGCTTNKDDETCNGKTNEGCVCLQGETRTCAQAGLVGKCAAAGATETCSAAGAWGACSVAPSASDTCVSGNNDNCAGAANEGCQCINGVTKRPCGACNDGTQVCTDGKTNTYGACTGAVLQPTTYYRDADGDGFGSAATTTTCGGPPAGYADQTGDCCDDGGNLAIAKTIFPGQTEFFGVSTTVCNVGWNYDCSANGSIQTSPAGSRPIGCDASCGTSTTPITSSDCGTSFCGGSCTVVGPKGTPCTLYCAQSVLVSCH
jgi:hypothetical protein